MLPEPKDCPSLRTEQTPIARIPFAVAFDLQFPAFRQFVPPVGKSEPVPEIAINEDCELYLAEYKVGPTGKITSVTLPGEFALGEGVGESQFRSRIPTPNPGHDSRSSLRRHDVPSMCSRSWFVRRGCISFWTGLNGVAG